jgi:hypothetical protein
MKTLNRMRADMALRIRSMRMACVLAACGFPAAVFAIGMGMEDVPLRPSELKLMQRIAAVDPTFRYGERVKRYFRTHPVTKNRIPLRVEVVAPQSKGLYFGEYISYAMTIDEPAGMVTYQTTPAPRTAAAAPSW